MPVLLAQNIREVKEMAYSFRGGIHPGTHADPGYKSATNTKPIEKLALPDEVILPVSMHIGAPAKPIVSVGDTVDLGQPIAEAGGFVSAPVHATVSGKVKAIEPRLHPNGSKVLSIVIENDGEDRKHESVHPYDFASMSNEERIECIRSAGIVGHGGATFPTHVKIQSGIGKCDTVIINAAECEPYITSDHRLLLERPEETIGGLQYDFSLADRDKAMHSGVIARTIVLDKLVKTYLSAHPGALAVNIACGLDTRCYRMQGYQHWYNLDLPETIAVREKLLPENGKISQIAMSAMDDWGGMIRESGDALVIIEGLTMYLSEADVQRIFDVIARRFPRVTVLVEVMNPLVVRNFKEKSIEGSHAKFTWGVRSGQALAALLPGFQLVEEHSLTEGMAEFLPIYKVLGKIPLVRNISNRIVVLQK